tara:strand:- start:174 stop:446 length:273 start_codon:yes stop_codon:yes gene_type:complete
MSHPDWHNRVTPLALSRSPEVKLWRAVLAAAVEDAMNEKALDYKGYYRPIGIRELEKDYFLHPSESFYLVCRYAGYDPEYVKRKMIEKLK